MKEVNAALGNIHVPALDNALKTALPGKCYGLSTYTPDRPISIWLDNSTVQADSDSALAIAAAHDPVFLTVDKTTIQRGGTDAATVTVTAPKPGAAAVTLSVSTNGGAAVDWPITLTGGVGTDTLTSLDPATITISVKNPANRSTDTITVKAV